MRHVLLCVLYLEYHHVNFLYKMLNHTVVGSASMRIKNVMQLLV